MTYKITLGLGRMANNFPKTLEIASRSEDEAISLAKSRYYSELSNEIGGDHPIFGKCLTVESVEVMS